MPPSRLVSERGEATGDRVDRDATRRNHVDALVAPPARTGRAPGVSECRTRHRADDVVEIAGASVDRPGVAAAPRRHPFDRRSCRLTPLRWLGSSAARRRSLGRRLSCTAAHLGIHRRRSFVALSASGTVGDGATSVVVGSPTTGSGMARAAASASRRACSSSRTRSAAIRAASASLHGFVLQAFLFERSKAGHFVLRLLLQGDKDSLLGLDALVCGRPVRIGWRPGCFCATSYASSTSAPELVSTSTNTSACT